MKTLFSEFGLSVLYLAMASIYVGMLLAFASDSFMGMPGLGIMQKGWCSFMEDIFETYGQAVIAAFSCIVLLGIAVGYFVNGAFAQYLANILNAIFG